MEGKQHGDVVAAIKAGGDETKLLVVDRETDEFFKKCRVIPSKEHLKGEWGVRPTVCPHGGMWPVARGGLWCLISPFRGGPAAWVGRAGPCEGKGCRMGSGFLKRACDRSFGPRLVRNCTASGSPATAAAPENALNPRPLPPARSQGRARKGLTLGQPPALLGRSESSDRSPGPPYPLLPALLSGCLGNRLAGSGEQWVPLGFLGPCPFPPPRSPCCAWHLPLPKPSQRVQGCYTRAGRG